MSNAKKFVIIIGGNRCGTTSLFHYLSDHQQIIPSIEKETRFFLDRDYNISRRSYYSYDGKMETYLNFFPENCNINDDQWYLDSTPDFLYSFGTPERIKDFFMRHTLELIALLRDPIDRFQSWFRYDKQLGNIPKRMTINEYMKENLTSNVEGPFSRLETGCYSHYLQKYWDLFPNQLNVYRFEQLKNDPNKLVEDILGKTGMDTTYSINDVVPHNASKEVKSATLNRIFIYLKQNFQNYIPQNSRFYELLKKGSKKYQQVNYKMLKKDTLDSQTRSDLQAYYKEEYRFLETI